VSKPKNSDTDDGEAVELDSLLVTAKRTEAISDGVFAVAITLLVLNLHVPSPGQQRAAGGALQALLAQWPSYLSYAATFLTVAFIWMNHHYLFARVRFVDQPLQWINIAILLGICLTPFPNALVASAMQEGLNSEAAKAATATYALIFMLTTVPWIFFWDRLARRPELLKPPHSEQWARRERVRGALGIFVYGAGIGVAYLSPVGDLVLFILIAAFFAATAGGLRPSGRAEAGSE
jgi:uncharacterized membrane protein